METCDDGHVQIVHNESSCPMCDVISEKEDMEFEKDEKISELEDEIEELNSNVDDLEQKYQALDGIEDSIKQAVKDRL